MIVERVYQRAFTCVLAAWDNVVAPRRIRVPKKTVPATTSPDAAAINAIDASSRRSVGARAATSGTDVLPLVVDATVVVSVDVPVAVAVPVVAAVPIPVVVVVGLATALVLHPVSAPQTLAPVAGTGFWHVVLQQMPPNSSFVVHER